jgi:hypothetical protein
MIRTGRRGEYLVVPERLAAKRAADIGRQRPDLFLLESEDLRHGPGGLLHDAAA